MTYKLPDKLLNKRSELIARCRHRTKFKLLTINFKNIGINSETSQKNVSNIHTWKK